ncbi:MAG: threonine--tRNA ligase, partial [Spirochaetes bacterium]|nr:threonine--tRNA ligase [Spirochaetota bacterium]
MVNIRVGKKEYQLEENHSLLELIETHLPGAKSNIVAAKKDDVILELNQPVTEDLDIEWISINSDQGIEILRHSAAHIMAASVCKLFPNTKLAIGPAIAEGFYYDFDSETRFSDSDFEQIEKEMQEIINRDEKFERTVIPRTDAIKMFSENNDIYKLELAEKLETDTVSLYTNGGFSDLCRGPHVPSTGYIKAFKLLKLAGAYWRGDEKNKMLQRIYGTSFADQKALKSYLKMLEEAKERDHRKIGKEMNLFGFYPEGPGFPFWKPAGMKLYNAVLDYWRKVHYEEGYVEVKTPIILNEELWHRSGHWDNYKENMYFTEIDEQGFAVKPMNCPGGLLVFKDGIHSYRELPLKIAELGLVHRHEKSGVLHGLLRVRQFTQDDAHVYCTKEQVKDEVIKVIQLTQKIYHHFGFEKVQLELSTRPEKYIGSIDIWDLAENSLKNALEELGLAYQINEGDGAFYGPKIDFHINDAIGRSWQCGTIQVDFSMPERFDINYIGKDGQKHRPVMIHRAILGS